MFGVVGVVECIAFYCLDIICVRCYVQLVMHGLIHCYTCVCGVRSVVGDAGVVYLTDDVLSCAYGMVVFVLLYDV